MDGLLLGWDAPAFRRKDGFGFGCGAAAKPDAGATPIVDDSDSHTLVCASTGTGKGRSFAIPTLLSWTGGVIAVDVKGELFAVSARHRRSLGPVLAVDPFRDTSDGSGAFNPLSQLDPQSPTFVDNAYTPGEPVFG